MAAYCDFNEIYGGKVAPYHLQGMSTDSYFQGLPIRRTESADSDKAMVTPLTFCKPLVHSLQEKKFYVYVYKISALNAVKNCML